MRVVETVPQEQRRIAFDLLGIDPDASERQIRRAYRRRVVLVHRTMAIDLASHLESLKWAYEKVREPALAIIREPARPRIDLARVKRQGATLAALAREREVHVKRVSEHAVASNAAMMKELSDEYDRRKREDARALAKKKQATSLVRVLLVIVLAAIATAAIWFR